MRQVYEASASSKKKLYHHPDVSIDEPITANNLNESKDIENEIDLGPMKVELGMPNSSSLVSDNKATILRK
jgi:hypothetical protein